MSRRADRAAKANPIASEQTVTLHAHRDAMFFRTSIGSGNGTLHDGRKASVEMTTNVAGAHPIVTVRVDGEDGWTCYTLAWDEIVRAACKAHSELFPPAPRGAATKGEA